MKVIFDIIKFIENVDIFYNIEYGIYPLANKKDIEKAIFLYLTEPRTLRIEFDSIDRENVRAIIEHTIMNNKNVDNLLKRKVRIIKR